MRYFFRPGFAETSHREYDYLYLCCIRISKEKDFHPFPRYIFYNLQQLRRIAVIHYVMFKTVFEDKHEENI